MLGRRKKRAVDVGRVASSALEAFLQSDAASRNGHGADAEEGTKGRGRRLGTMGAVALGATAVGAGRAVFRCVRRLDLAEAAARVEDRLKKPSA